MRIVLVNSSKYVSDSECRAIAHAVQAQVDFDFSPTWRRFPVPVRFLPAVETLEKGDIVLTLEDRDRNKTGTLGFHDEAGDLPQGVVFVDPILAAGGTVLGDPKGKPGLDTVSSVISHEALEILGDPSLNLWVDGPDGDQYSLEVSDPVQEILYGIEIRHEGRPRFVTVSDFVTPEWFDIEVGTKRDRYSYQGAVKKPFTKTEGGYFIVRSSRGRERVMGTRRPLALAIKPENARRSYRRLFPATRSDIE